MCTRCADGAGIDGLSVQSIHITLWETHASDQERAKQLPHEDTPKYETKTVQEAEQLTAVMESQGQLPRAPGQPCQLLKSGEALGKEPSQERSHLRVVNCC